MDETEQSKQSTPLGNERRDNPGQTNIMMNSDGTDTTPSTPQWDENTPLEDITSQYTGIGDKFNDLVENAADNVGDRQVQLIGNDFGATNPYMFNTYYEPAATSFASKMRVQGTEEALNEGLTRAEKEAQNNLAAAKQRYNNALAAQKAREEAARNANAYVSETDVSKLPQSTAEKEFIASEEFQNMSEEERSDRLTSIRTKDMQDTLEAAGDHINWDIKADRKVATDRTLEKFGLTREQLKAMSQAEKDAFWGRTDVGNYWTEQYMLNYFEKHYSADRASAMQESFNDIHSDVNAIIDAINNNKVDDLDIQTFKTAVPVSLNTYTADSMRKSIEESDIGDDVKSRMYEILDQYNSDYDRAWLEQAVNALAQDKIALNESNKTVSRLAEDGDWWKKLMGNPAVTTFGAVVGAPSTNKKTYEDFAKAADLLACFEGDRGEAATVNAISETLNLGTPERTNPDWYGKVEYRPLEYQWHNEVPVSESQQEEIVDYVKNDAFTAAFGVDWDSIRDIAEMKAERPDDYNYLLNQVSFILSDNPVEIVEDEDKEYFINGEYKKLSKGDLVFHTIDGMVDKDGKFRDSDLQHYVDLYKDIYNGKEPASEENLKALQKYFGEYQARTQAAMAASGRFGVKVDEDVYGAMILIMSDQESNTGDKLLFNPNDPHGDKISLNEFRTWFGNLKEDEQYNFYTAIANRARQTTGHYYIYDEKIGGMKDILGGKSNGEDVIGKRNKKEGDSNMWAADKVKDFSDEQCLAMNMILDDQMRRGSIKTSFFDNDEVGLYTRYTNKFFSALNGSVDFFRWAGLSLAGNVMDIFQEDKDNWFYKRAGDVWDNMTTLNAADDDKYFKDKDMVLGNNYTMEVRAQQRANLNHLIDTTFNIDYFNPDNEYDPATGQVKDKDGNVISYTDAHYFHADKFKAGLDTATDMAAYISEFVLECWGSGEISKLGTKLGTSIVNKSVAAQKFVKLLSANATITGVKSALRANKELSATAKAVKEMTKKGAKISVKNAKYGKAVLNVANRTKEAEAAGKAVGTALGGNSFVDDAIRAGGRTAASEADNVVSALNNVKNGASRAEKGASVTDDLLRSGDSLADDLAKTTGKVTDNIVDGMYEGEMKLAAAGIDMPAEGVQQQMVRNYAMDTLIESADASTVDSANKLASYIEKALTKTGNVLDKISPFKGTVESLRSMLSSSALNMLQRSAMNVRVAEAAGVSVEQVSKLSDNAISVLYNALRVSEGKATTDIGAYVSRYINKAGKATAAGGLDFSQAVKKAVNQSETLAAAGSKAGLSADDTIRILANSSNDKNVLLNALQADSMLKERITDWAQDIKMNYYTPYLDNEFNSDYTDIGEYFTDPTQWLSGAVFDIGATGLRRLGNSVSLSLTNQKINKLLGKIDVSPSSAVDKAKLNRNLVKLNKARMKADKLTNKILDGTISVNKVTEVKDRATRTLDEYMNTITDGFDYAKGMDQMASIMDTAMAERNTWDKVQEFFTTSKGTPLLGRSRTMQAMDLNRYLLKSNDSLNAFYMLAQAEQSSAIINFADIKAHTDNLRKISGKQWATISADGFQKSLLKKTSDMFDGLNGNTINVADKAKAKAMLQEGQTVLYDAIYDSAYEKLHDKAGAAIDWPAFRSELNWVRDKMVEMGSKQIDMGNSVRWNYFPTQGIMFDMDPDTPIALAGFYYGSGLHPDVSNQMANPFDTRDTWDMATISDNVLNGKESYSQPLGKKEMIKNEKLGIEGTTKEIPYNMDFFNPAYALTAYQNAFNSKQFAAKMFDPMQNGHVVVRDDSALDFATSKTDMELEGAAAAREAKLKKEYVDAHRPKTYRNAKKLAQDIDALQTKAKRGITDVQKNIKNVSSRDINAQNTKLKHQTAKAEQMVAKSDLFKGYRDYAGLKGKSNKTVAAHMMENYNLVVSDVAAARKALKGGLEAAEGVSDAYKSNTLYRKNVDALARDKNLTKDVLKNQQNILIGGEKGVQLNANALKTPFYNTMISLEQSKRTNASWKEFLDTLATDPALRQGRKYTLEDFTKIHKMDETDLRKNLSAKIYDIVRGRYGAVDGYTGSLKLNETFSKSINQAIYDAYDEVALRKASGEGIALVEVLEELNEKFPGMEVVGDDRYWNLLTSMSKYSNGGGDPTTLQASIGAELNKMSQDGNLNSEDAKTLVQMASLVSEVSDNSSRLSGIAGNTGATKDIDEALEAGDERMLADVDADPEKQHIARELADKEAAEIEAGRAGKEQQIADVKGLISKYGDVANLSDRQRMEVFANGMDILARNASGRSDVTTRTNFNTQAFNTFRNDVKKPYQEIAGEIEAKLAKKGVEISKANNAILNPPEKGLFEGMSDAQYLKIQRELERGQTVKIKGGNYTKESMAIERAKNIGQDGRGIVAYYKPKALQQLVDQHNIKLSKKNAAALKRLTDGTTEFSLGGGSSAVGYAEFAEAMMGTEYRYTPKDDIVNLRTAVENDIAAHKTDATRLLKTDKQGLGVYNRDFRKKQNMDSTAELIGFDGRKMKVDVVNDYGTKGASDAAAFLNDEVSNSNIGYHFEITAGDGTTRYVSSVDDLYNLLDNDKYKTVNDVVDDLDKQGIELPKFDDEGRSTDYFRKEYEPASEKNTPMWEIDKNRVEVLSEQIKKDRAEINELESNPAKKPTKKQLDTYKQVEEWKKAGFPNINKADLDDWNYVKDYNANKSPEAIKNKKAKLQTAQNELNDLQKKIKTKGAYGKDSRYESGKSRGIVESLFGEPLSPDDLDAKIDDLTIALSDETKQAVKEYRSKYSARELAEASKHQNPETSADVAGESDLDFDKEPSAVALEKSKKDYNKVINMIKDDFDISQGNFTLKAPEVSQAAQTETNDILKSLDSLDSPEAIEAKIKELGIEPSEGTNNAIARYREAVEINETYAEDELGWDNVSPSDWNALEADTEVPNTRETALMRSTSERDNAIELLKRDVERSGIANGAEDVPAEAAEAAEAPMFQFGPKNKGEREAREAMEIWNQAQAERFMNYSNAPKTVLTPQDYLRSETVEAPTVETFKGKWTVEDVASADDKVFLFGDNIKDSATGYKPKSTQAVIRGEYNAIGIPTKKDRGTSASSYFTDDDFDMFKDGVDVAIAQARESGKIIVLPEDGIGTGAAQLKKRAPGCYEYLQEQLDNLNKPISGTSDPSDIRNPDNWVNPSEYANNSKTAAARRKYVSEYNRYQKLVDATKDYTANNSALSFASETTGYNMSIAEQNLNNFLYGDTNGTVGHFDKVAEISDRINKLQSDTEKLFDKKISDNLSALKKLDGTPYEDLVETLEAAKKEAVEAYKETPAVQKQIAKRFDEEIDFVKQKLGKTKLDAQKFADHDPELKALKDASASHKAVTPGEGQVTVHNIGGMLIVGKGTTVQNRISLADLREANEVVDIKTAKTLNPIESVSRAKNDKKVLKDMRKSFNDGWEIKGKVSGNTSRQQNAWIDNIVEEIKARTGNPDIDEANIYVDKQLANLGQFYFREGRQGWQEKAYKAMSSISELNKQIQDFHLAGGVGQFNAFTLRNAVTMMWQDPVGGTRALFTNFNNAKSNTSVMKFFINNHEKLLKYAIDSGDFSVINAFAPVISMDERLVGGGVIDGVINQIYGAKNTFATALEREGKRSAVLSVPKGIYNEIFSNPTFARWTIIAKADMQMRNYAKAQKFVNRIASRYNLSDEDFAKADNGMWGSKDQYIATLARLRTDRYWNPADFAKTGFSTKKYLKRKEKGDMKTTAESLKGIQAERSMADCASDFFFAINYKLQMNAHPINGFGSMVASVLTVPRASLMARNGNLAPMAMRFAGRGDRTQAAVMIGIAALAHWWNTSIGAPSAWEELWGDHGNKDNGTYGMAQSLLNFQDFGKFWIPNDGNGGFDMNKEANSVDPFFSIFTLQNTGARALNKAMNPNQIPINWQRTVSTEPTSLATRIGGVADELIGANLLAGYKALYEVCMNSTYFGNNIWERKYLPDGTVNKNYNPVRNVIASMAHILNLDAVLEGKGFTENGSNRWVKGLTIEGGRGLIVGDPGVRQDKTGTVSGSGIFQHEYASALGAASRGEYFDGLTEAMELPFKSRNFASRAKTALNQEVMLAMRNELHKYEKAIKNASTEEKDGAYAEFANAAVNIMHDWSAKYGNVLGQNDELTSTATKIMVAFLADEYNDQTAYVQNMYDHLRQELKMADGDQFLFKKEKMQEAIAAGMDPEEAAAMYNKHLTALKEAQIAEYNARKALLDAGINIDPDENIFDTSDIIHADKEAKQATINKKLLTEVKGKLDSKIGEFSNYKEMKAYYEDLIDNASTTKQKVKIAKEYNQMVEDVIAPYLEEYGESILNSAYWDGDYVSNHLGNYLIIPADTQYRGKTPYSNFLKDEFGVGYRDNKNLPSDKEIKEAIQKANQALAQGRMASTRAIVDNALVQSRRGTIHASDEDYEKLLRLRAMLSSRSN